MSVKYVEVGASTQKNIFARPDGIVAYAFKHAKATASVPGLATQINGRYIVQAGTIYPANDTTAIGIVVNDYDVTDGDKVLAVAIQADVYTAALPEAPSSNAIAALKGINFLPFAGTNIPVWDTDNITGATYVAESTDATTKTVAVKFKQRIGFRSGATEKEKWTITGESTTKVTVDSIALSDDGYSAIFTLKTTAGTAVKAGTVTVKPSAAVVETNEAPAQAVTIATVSAAE